MKIRIIVILFFVKCFGFSQQISSIFLPPPSDFECVDARPKLNQLIYGADPGAIDGIEKPILIFVHGWFDNGFGFFFMGNTMYENAYNNGYRTAYTNQSQTNSFELNGQIIANMVKQVSAYYGHSKNIIIVAHSKGGLDVEQAMVNYGIDSLVKGVIALSVPFYGVPLTDWTASIIRPILNNIPIFGEYLKDKGTRQMQTANMVNRVRPAIDNNPNNHPEKYFTFGGWGYYKITKLPLTLPANLLSLISYSNPPCVELPMGGVYGSAISLLFKVSGGLTKISQLPFSVDIPDNEKFINDGLSPYASTLRPGSLNVGGKIGEQSAFLNHFDFLWGATMWPKILPVLQNIENNEFQKQTSSIAQTQTISNTFFLSTNLLSSKMGLTHFLANTDGTANLEIIGYVPNQKISIVDNQGIEIKEVVLSSENIFGNFAHLDLEGLMVDKTYSLVSTDHFFATKIDEISKLKLKTNLDNLALKDNQPLVLSIESNDDKLYSIVATIEKIQDPNDLKDISYKKEFILKHNNISYNHDEAIFIDEGLYNLSILAKSDGGAKFFTTSFIVENRLQEQAIINSAPIIFPNPSNGEFKISLPTNSSLNNQITIYNSSGLKVWSVSSIGIDSKVDINTDLASGVYILKVENQEFNSFSKLMIVK